MNILVVLRMMPDPSGELELAEDGMALDREWLDLKLNDFDDHALEEAVLLKEAYGASVTAAAVGEGANRVLHMALARGADRAILVDCDPGAMISSRALAKTVAELAKQNGIDLILTGVQTPEDVFGQLAPYVGALLDWPHVSSTSGVAFAEGEVQVSQERGGGATAHYSVQLPAVLGVQTASKAPRYVSGSKLREAAKAEIGKVSQSADLLPEASRITALRPPRSDKNGVKLGSNPEEVATVLLTLFAERGLTRKAAQ